MTFLQLMTNCVTVLGVVVVGGTILGGCAMLLRVLGAWPEELNWMIPKDWKDWP